jgi:hypothetical protein
MASKMNLRRVCGGIVWAAVAGLGLSALSAVPASAHSSRKHQPDAPVLVAQNGDRMDQDRMDRDRTRTEQDRMDREDRVSRRRARRDREIRDRGGMERDRSDRMMDRDTDRRARRGSMSNIYTYYRTQNGHYPWERPDVAIYAWSPYDIDGDGYPNRRDRDSDGDGVFDSKDRYPLDWNRRYVTG